MIYRRKTYRVNPDYLLLFNEHFNRTLLPAQQKYGARLIGRWMTTEVKGSVEVFAIWEYASMEEYQQIEQHVRNDREHMERVEGWYNSIGGRAKVENVFLTVEQDFLASTVE